MLKDRLHDLIAAHPALFRCEASRTASWLLPGWYGLADRLCSRIEGRATTEELAGLEITQIKDKHGLLSISIDGPDWLDELVFAAEDESEHTCAVCGRRGWKRSEFTFATARCDEHAET